MSYNLGLTARITQNHEDYLAGRINYLPFKPLGKFTELFPGLMRGELTAFTGTPASSKTSLAKKLIIHDGIEWAVNNNKNLHILYFGMEESKSQFLYSLLSHQGFLLSGIQYNIKDFECIGRTIKKEDIPLIDRAEKRVEKMLPFITYITDTYNSYGIWKKIREFASKRGKFYYKGVEASSFGEDHSWDTYVANDPNEFVVVVLDHLLLLSRQKDEKDLAEAMWNTVEYTRRFAANKLNYAVVPIQHQNADSENQKSREANTILPTENGLAENKAVARSYLNLIGIANPNKVNAAGTQPTIRIWDGHDLTKFGNYMRTINILKSRYGESTVHASMFFGGRTGYFEAIPTVGTSEYQDFLQRIKTFK